ncbi:unnamed protein product, partial [Prorocentrum cordatum]
MLSSRDVLAIRAGPVETQDFAYYTNESPSIFTALLQHLLFDKLLLLQKFTNSPYPCTLQTASAPLSLVYVSPGRAVAAGGHHWRGAGPQMIEFRASSMLHLAPVAKFISARGDAVSSPVRSPVPVCRASLKGMRGPLPPPPRGDALAERSCSTCLVECASWPHRSGNATFHDGRARSPTLRHGPSYSHLPVFDLLLPVCSTTCKLADECDQNSRTPTLDYGHSPFVLPPRTSPLLLRLFRFTGPALGGLVSVLFHETPSQVGSGKLHILSDICWGATTAHLRPRSAGDGAIVLVLIVAIVSSCLMDGPVVGWLDGEPCWAAWAAWRGAAAAGRAGWRVSGRMGRARWSWQAGWLEPRPESSRRRRRLGAPFGLPRCCLGSGGLRPGERCRCVPGRARRSCAPRLGPGRARPGAADELSSSYLVPRRWRRAGGGGMRVGGLAGWAWAGRPFGWLSAHGFDQGHRGLTGTAPCVRRVLCKAWAVSRGM